MRRLAVILGMVTILSMATATSVQCAREPTTITVEVVNDTPVGIEATFEYSPDPNITQDELLATGAVASLTVGSGLVESFDLDCVDAEALILDQATLLVTGGGVVGSEILYQGDAFFCGEVLTFRFIASEDLAVLDFEFTFRDQ